MKLYLSKVIFDKDYHPKFYVKFHVLYNVTLGTSSFRKQCDDFILYFQVTVFQLQVNCYQVVQIILF